MNVYAIIPFLLIAMVFFISNMINVWDETAGDVRKWNSLIASIYFLSMSMLIIGFVK